MFPGGGRIPRMIYGMLPELDLYYSTCTGPAQHLRMTGCVLHDLDRDVFGVCAQPDEELHQPWARRYYRVACVPQILRLYRFSTCAEAHWFRLHRAFSVTDPSISTSTGLRLPFLGCDV